MSNKREKGHLFVQKRLTKEGKTMVEGSDDEGEGNGCIREKKRKKNDLPIEVQTCVDSTWLCVVKGKKTLDQTLV